MNVQSDLLRSVSGDRWIDLLSTATTYFIIYNCQCSLIQQLDWFTCHGMDRWFDGICNGVSLMVGVSVSLEGYLLPS